LKEGLIWEAEYSGELIEADDKVVVHRARLIREMNWTERTSRLFACDCAWHVLKIFEKRRPKDKRVRKCIQTARRVARGTLPKSELAAAGAAAGAAAWNAARAAAWNAARAAEREWQTRRLFKYLDGTLA
jgi:hypothetical protein